uniref:RNA-directed DNA polymerase n=1 Tax=Anoplophora glabripennis TaxID=217634 RepID=V5GPT7_ANOGL
MDNKGQVDVVYTDFSKAFDKVNYGILLNKLSLFGLNDNLILLIKSYLSQRELYVSYNGFKSENFIATSGVPQGSNLGPLLFILFINDLSLSLKSNHLFFADDLKLFLSVSNLEDCLILQEQVDLVSRWCENNQLPINIDKCKICSFTSKKEPLVFGYTLENALLARCDNVKDLGVIYDNRLSFTDHINTIINAANRSLSFIVRNSSSFNDVTALKCLFYSLVRSKLEYCSLIWYPYYQIHTNKLEKVQRRFLKFLSFRIDGYYPNRGFEHRLLLD